MELHHHSEPRIDIHVIDFWLLTDCPIQPGHLSRVRAWRGARLRESSAHIAGKALIASETSQKRKRLVVIADEATHQMPIELLEKLRLLTNENMDRTDECQVVTAPSRSLSDTPAESRAA
jgi:hypothetical protein